jgi:hypothetical protein
MSYKKTLFYRRDAQLYSVVGVGNTLEQAHQYAVQNVPSDSTLVRDCAWLTRKECRFVAVQLGAEEA